jgi:hypothetical protein
MGVFSKANMQRVWVSLVKWRDFGTQSEANIIDCRPDVLIKLMPLRGKRDLV